MKNKLTLILLAVLLAASAGVMPVASSPQTTFVPETVYLGYSDFEINEGSASAVNIGPANRLLKAFALEHNATTYPRIATTVGIPFGATTADIAIFFYPSNTNGGTVSLFAAAQGLGGGFVGTLDTAQFNSISVSTTADEQHGIGIGSFTINSAPLFKNQVMRLIVGRDGSATDTHTGDIWVIGVKVLFQ